MFRNLLQAVRRRTSNTARFAGRLNRVARYGLDLVLWSRLYDRRLDAAPVELSRSLLEEKGVRHAAPSLQVSGLPNQSSVWDEGFAGVNATLLLNLQKPDELSALRYAHPGPSFAGVYLWDSAFISQVWSCWDRSVACDVAEAVVALRDGDRLQHVVAHFSESIYTQPPLLAWAANRLADGPDAPDRAAWLKRMYDALVGYHGWLREHRRTPSGLYAWSHPYESGIDNAPRFSTRDESEFADTTVLESPDFSAYVVLQCEALARLAQLLGRDGAGEHLAQADEIRERMNERLWSEVDRLYYDRHTETGEFVRSKTIASLLPLWAGVPDGERAAALAQHLEDELAFGTRIPLPTVARSDPDFAKDMWRGPVWINTAYAVLEGLLRYERYELAAELAYRLCDGVYETFSECRRFFEFYDPDRPGIEQLHRKSGNRWKHFTLGSKPVGEFVGWTGLVNTLVIETLVGFRRLDGRRVLKPLVPVSARGVSFSVRLPQEGLAIAVEREGDRILATVRNGGPTRRFDLAFGEAIDLDTEANKVSTTQATRGGYEHAIL